MKKYLIWLAVSLVVALGVYLWIEMGPHKVTFVSAETHEPYADSNIEITYVKFCISSPCRNTTPRTIYKGTTNAAGTVTLWGHRDLGLNNLGRMVENSVYINGEMFDHMDGEQSTNRIIYLIKSSEPVQQ